MNLSTSAFGITSDGQAVTLYTLTNSTGITARIIDFGAIVVGVETPDRNGNLADITLGFDELARYEKKHPFFGAIAGRYANRIANGRFTLNGNTYQLAINNGPNSLHGGLKGFDKAVWAAEEVAAADAVGVKLIHISPDGDENYPGTLSVTVTYWLTEANELKLEYTATTDADTVLNLTNHSYFNLKGEGNGDILDHVMMVNADRFTPVNENLIPTGELRPVKGTPHDFTTPTPIGERINEDDEQLMRARGYDHNYVLNDGAGVLGLAARVTEATTGRVLECYTTEPGMQLYTGNFLDGSVGGKNGKSYPMRYGFCLETQHFPDSPNQPDFPNVVLRPGETYTQTTIYKFGAE